MAINAKTLSTFIAALVLPAAAMGSCDAPIFGNNYQSTDFQEAQFNQCEDVERQQQQQTWQEQEKQQKEQQQEQRQWDKEARELRQDEGQGNQQW